MEALTTSKLMRRGKDIGGRAVVVSEARPKPEGGSGGGGRGGGRGPRY